MAGARFDGVQLNRRDLRQPFPTGFARRLKGQSVRALVRRGKYLLGELSSGDTLVMHLGMSGWFRVEKSKRSTARRNRETDLDNRHDHVVFTMSSGMTVTFNDPRRFGIMDLITADRLARHASLGRLGPEPLARVRRQDVGPTSGEAPDFPEGRPARSARRGRHRQHLRERGAASGRPVAVPTGVVSGHQSRRAAGRLRTAGPGDQVGASPRNCPEGVRALSRLAFPRLRP
jgi:hypothetical protein